MPRVRSRSGRQAGRGVPQLRRTDLRARRARSAQGASHRTGRRDNRDCAGAWAMSCDERSNSARRGRGICVGGGRAVLSRPAHVFLTALWLRVLPVPAQQPSSVGLRRVGSKRAETNDLSEVLTARPATSARALFCPSGVSRRRSASGEVLALFRRRARLARGSRSP